MTSRRLFFNAMKEDLRHKIWIFALFGLICFLALPMPWLVMRSNMQADMEKMYYYSEVEIGRELNFAIEFLSEYLLAVGGFIAITAGLVMGLLGFRYVFHKNKVDTYHSLPIKRSMLYGVCYVDGILIWLLPFLLCILLTLFLAGGYVGRLSGMGIMIKICGLAGRNILVLLTIFLMVYHLVLIAVMMSGNVLNTFVNLLLLGFGVCSVYGIWIIFMRYYLCTFYNRALLGDVMIYSSPFLSACSLIVRAADTGGTGEFWAVLFCYFLTSALLGMCGWILYRKRASELAEQGIRNKAVTAVLRMIPSAAAGMGGWMIFIMLTDNMGGLTGALWKSFGAVLVSVFVFGVLNVVFHMEFGAFFAHKIQMAQTVVITLLLCFAFSGDWFGYDIYLPPKEEIAHVAVYDQQFSNRQASYMNASEQALERMKFQDEEAIYAFLERAANMKAWIVENREDAGSINYEKVDTKVTLKNGGSYYRSYFVPADKELLWPLFTSREYLECSYLISEESMPELYRFALFRDGQKFSVENAQAAAALAVAYNQDVLEHVEELLSGEGKLLAEVRLWGEKQRSGHQNVYALGIYSFMEHTIEALEQAGNGEWVREWEASEISSVRLGMHSDQNGKETAEEIVSKAMKEYGVKESGEENRQEDGAGSLQTLTSETDYYVYNGYGAAEDMDYNGTLVVEIVDPGEIEEILPYINYAKDNTNSALRRQYVNIQVIDRQGKVREGYFPKGCLPMKYIRRFAEAAEKR